MVTMKGSHTQSGEVTIKFNSQADWLLAPSLPDGTPQKYLPCSECGEILHVDTDLISAMCDICHAHYF